MSTAWTVKAVTVRRTLYEFEKECLAWNAPMAVGPMGHCLFACNSEVSSPCPLPITCFSLSLAPLKSLGFLVNKKSVKMVPKENSKIQVIGKLTVMCLFLLSFFFFKVFYFYLFFPFIFISWRLITWQYCSGFCHTLTWISHRFTCVPQPEPPSHLLPHPIPLGHPSAPALSTCLMHPTWAGDLFHTW